MKKKIGILESSDFSKQAINKLQNLGEVYLFDGENIEGFISDKDILFVRLKYQLTDVLLKNASKLRYICTPTTGLNHIDTKYLEKRDIEVLSLKGEYKFLSNIRATPEHIFGLTISLLRNYKSAFELTLDKDWDREKYKGNELYCNSVGIIGFGRIGKILERYFLSFGSRLYYYDVDESIESKYGSLKCISIDELIEKSNIVILNTSFSEKDHSFFDAKYIDLLKNKYFVNASRGECIDEGYLIKKIEEDYFKGIAIDVIQNEAYDNNNLHKFLKLNVKQNFIITPHIGGATYNSMWITEEFITDKLFENLFSDK